MASKLNQTIEYVYFRATYFLGLLKNGWLLGGTTISTFKRKCYFALQAKVQTAI